MDTGQPSGMLPYNVAQDIRLDSSTSPESSRIMDVACPLCDDQLRGQDLADHIFHRHACVLNLRCHKGGGAHALIKFKVRAHRCSAKIASVPRYVRAFIVRGRDTENGG